VGLESVANIPAGFTPAADHVLIFVRQVDRYRWQSEGLFEHDGKIVGIVTGCTYFAAAPVYASFGASQIAPGARTYLVPPPADNAPLDKSRNSQRTGNALVDSILDAMASSDGAALQKLIQYAPVPCGTSERAPACHPGQQAGDSVDAFPLSACNGGGILTEGMPQNLPELLDGLFVYAVVSYEGSPHQSQGPVAVEEHYAIVLATSDYRGMEVVSIGSEGITSLRGDCGYRHPEWLIEGGNPDYLLPPPPGLVAR
jgi:hypothetical protein